MPVRKQAVVDKEKLAQKRLAAAEAARVVRKEIAQAHETFPEINSLVRDIREGATS